MENIAEMKVGKIVAQNFRTAKILTEKGIDFCCKGGITLTEACRLKDVSLETLLTELEDTLSQPYRHDYEGMDLRDLIRHIVKVHHQYIESTVPALKAYLEKLCQVHGGRHPELHEINRLFFEASDALIKHMKKEELILFPYIHAMCEANEIGYPLSRPHFGHISNPVSMMKEEHDTEGERFREISRLSGNYQCPPDGCQTYRVAYEMLKDFEADLHKHIHLENNILFPKAEMLFHHFSF